MGLYCIDAHDEAMVLWGQNNFNYNRLEFIYSPCTPNPANNTCMN
jgi:hypothetical protein